jgi:hypothetical protein
MQWSFSVLVRTLLKEHSMSGNQLADLISYDRGAMARIITGDRPCSPQVAELMDTALRAQGRVIAGAAAASAPHAADRARRALEAALRRRTEPASEVGDWTRLAADFGSQARLLPPPLLLNPLSAAVQDLTGDIIRQRSASAQHELMRIAALLGGLVCRTLVISGDQVRAARWVPTARQAALASGDEVALAWVARQEAVSHYHAGDLRRAAAAVGTALAAASGAPGAKAEAAAVASLQMRIHAISGDAAGARAARWRTERLYSQAGADSRAPAAWGYDTRRLAVDRAEVLFFLGDPAARSGFDDALGQPIPREDYLYWAGARLSAAWCMIRDGDADVAFDYLTETIIALTPEERLGLVTVRCRQVLALLPGRLRESEAGRRLRALLISPPPGRETVVGWPTGRTLSALAEADSGSAPVAAGPR